MKITGKILLLLFIFAFNNPLNAQKALKFNADGNFKIVQFTDVHYKKGNPNSNIALELIKEVLEVEKPDLVVFTGDVVWDKPAYGALDDVFDPVAEAKIPWAYILGNHDDEFEVSREELIRYATNKPYCIASPGDKYLNGEGNYILELLDKDGEKIKNILYFMDSGAYSRIKGVKGYNWFDFNQIDWYRKNSKAYTESNKGEPYPSLAFFHIPLPEYSYMTSDTTWVYSGNKKEAECNPKLNSGMFTAMREQGDIMGTFTGHDHDNDYIGMYYDIALAYGRYSGGKTVYNNLGNNGCRIINMKEGKKTFSSYILLKGGEKLFEVTYPNSFKKSK